MCDSFCSEVAPLATGLSLNKYKQRDKHLITSDCSSHYSSWLPHAPITLFIDLTPPDVYNTVHAKMLHTITTSRQLQ